MGLSSSQARLLHLTSRMHQLEYKAAKLEAEKLQMANESDRVYEEYLNALDKTKIQGKLISTDGSITYTDVTYQAMLDRGYQIKFEGDDRVVISAATEANYIKASGSKDNFIALETGRVDANNKATDGYYEIYTADQLLAILGSNTVKNIRLMSDIDLAGKTWTPSGYRGTFDGNGHTISNNSQALFSELRGATVKNLTINANVSSSDVTGGLANTSMASNIINVIVNGTVNSSNKDSVGGVIGEATTTTFENVTSNVNVTASAYRVGGILGAATDSRVTITDSTSTGTIINSASDIKNSTGGLVGESWANNLYITNSSSSSNIIATNGSTNYYTGGLVGQLEGALSLTDSQYTGTATKDGVEVQNIVGSNPSYTSGTTTGNIGATTSVEQTVNDTGNYGSLFESIQKYGYILEGDASNPATGHENDATWFANMVNSGMLYIYTPDSNSDDGYVQTSVSTNTDLQEVSDTSEIKKAEAKYEADMKKIDRKDSKYDSDIAALDTERNAIKNEMDTLKSVAKDNVERTFKIFS